MITNYLLFIITLLIGYALGRNAVTKDTYQEIKKQVERKVYPHLKQPSGIIQRPDAKRIHELHNPQITEEKEAMQSALDQGVEPLTI